jgi:hypothetical protein
MRVVLLLALTCLVAACVPPELVFPSPDGRHTATVRNHFSIDPPRQSLWVDGTKIVTLGEDMDWCDTVAWSRDGSTVAFLVQNAKVITVDVAARRTTGERWLVAHDGYPTSEMVCNLALSDDGQDLTFTTKPRR